MAKCKYCDAQISRLDKEICPFCGGKNPLDGVDTSTEDITKYLDAINSEKDKSIFKPKSRKIAALLAVILGVFGVHSFYLNFKNHGIITIIISIILIGGVGSLLFFSSILRNPFAFLIPYFTLEAFMIGVAIRYLCRSNLRDGRGEFIR